MSIKWYGHDILQNTQFYYSITFSILYSLASWCHAENPDNTLVWADEFNGDSLDYSKWGVEENAYGGGNNEQQIYRWDPKKNLRVEDGNSRH